MTGLTTAWFLIASNIHQLQELYVHSHVAYMYVSQKQRKNINYGFFIDSQCG